MVRDGLVGIGASAVVASNALAAEDAPLTLAGLIDFDRQEVAALTTGGAVLGFSVVCAILLMRNRLRAARTANPALTLATLDYWDPSDRRGVADLYARERAAGFLPYVATLALDRLLPEHSA